MKEKEVKMKKKKEKEEDEAKYSALGVLNWSLTDLPTKVETQPAQNNNLYFKKTYNQMKKQQ